MDLREVHLLGLFLTAVITAVAAYWVRRQTDDRAGMLMTVLLALGVVLSTLVALQLLVPTLALKSLFGLLYFSLILVEPTLLLVFAIHFTGRQFWLTKSVRLTLVLFAGASALLVLTEPIHGLLFLDPSIAPDPFPHLVVEWTQFATVVSALSSVPVLIGFGLLFHMHLFSRRTSWWQSGALLFGLFFVLVPAWLSLTDFVPVRGFPYGIYGTSGVSVIIAFGLFKRNLFGVAPLARGEMFSSLDDGVLVVDAERRIVDFNETAETLFDGLDSRLGDPLDEAIPSLFDVEEPSTPSGSIEAEPGPFAPTLDLARGEGDRTLRVHVSEITSGGEPRGYVLVLRDVTELERYAAELEQRTEQLEQFASVLSHDLRNPVTVAAGRIELELEGEDSENLRTARHAIDRIEATIDDLLTLAHSGETVTDPEPLALRTVAEDAWETSDTGSVTLSFEIDDEYRIRADRSRLATLLENLFRNAADHGGRHVTVGPIESESADASDFFVADDGPGVPVDERDWVFEYGYSTADEGTGFGLAIVRSVADAHDWSVAVTESDEGGARFEVTGTESPGSNAATDASAPSGRA